MNRILSLFLIIPLLFAMGLIFIYYQFCSAKNEAMAQLRLQYAINYCTDDAADAMMDVDDLGMDYVDWDKADIDPDLAVNEFVDTFLLNYDYIPTKELRDMVKLAYIKSFVVCVYDGYYMYAPQVVNDEGDFDLVASMKQPYVYKNGSKSYALNLSNRDSYSFDGSDIRCVPSPVDKGTCLSIINGQVSTAITQQMDALYSNGWTSKVNLLAGTTKIQSSNAVRNPTVIALLDEIDIDKGFRQTAFGLAGSAVQHFRPIAGYVRNGVKYYCYADMLPESITNKGSMYIKDTFASPREAAEAGYNYDPMYMEYSGRSELDEEKYKDHAGLVTSDGKHVY